MRKDNKKEVMKQLMKRTEIKQKEIVKESSFEDNYEKKCHEKVVL